MENTVLYLINDCRLIAVNDWGSVALMMFSPLRGRRAEQVIRKIKGAVSFAANVEMKRVGVHHEY